ncbi:restriction endonuclease [Cupriavidus sp. AcVe19-6a]|uniref:5-methylcytosine restriction system specificity protein McrC n=1 Tax=Cupriavidus sp. AcVe19-6a TaxID=2821358 RepID=UPI001AEAEBC4|nr:restriction endonuclease [Cupriavidus sp. AcVe19-6a]MBP0635925.1 restriction endonuclease [Cupriavidus sp. AcVe19-6a]
MAHNRTRLSLVEYGAPVDLSRDIAAAAGLDRTKANSLLTDAGSRAASSLGLGYNPISVDAKGARAIDFAGLIRLAPSLELEVAPKFLGLDDADAAWREDFFFLSTLSRHGRLLASERLSASGGAPRDLSTLVARSITSMYEARKRRPLRTYRRVREADFFIDGDPDPVDLMFPSPDGFTQDLIRFDRRNGWNAYILAAAKELLPEVSDPSTAGSLVRLIEDLSPQDTPANRRKPLPARHKAWKSLHDISVDVLGGLGLNYKQGQAHAPGYLVATWRVWEDLLTVAARLGFGRSAVVPQKGFTLGTKTKLSMGTVSNVSVYPDCVIQAGGARPRILLDAKYKGHVERGQLRISEADIYEALAFSRAACCNLVVLAYPAQPGGEPQPVGTCTVFERVLVDAVQIVGVQIEIRLISKMGALKTFAANMAAGVSAAFT